jgi:hypothetical protein
MRKETLVETNLEPQKNNNNRTARSLGGASKIIPVENSSDKINIYSNKDGQIPRYSDFYEEFDDLERNEDTFAPDID